MGSLVYCMNRIASWLKIIEISQRVIVKNSKPTSLQSDLFIKCEVVQKLNWSNNNRYLDLLPTYIMTINDKL